MGGHREKAAAAAAAKSLQSCPTLCDPTDGIPPGSSVPGILQARTLEWVAISFSKVAVYKPGKETSVELDHAGTLIQTSSLQNCEKINFWWLNHPLGLW